MTLNEAMKLLEKGERVTRPSWPDSDHLVHYCHIEPLSRSGGEIYMVELIPTCDLPGCCILGVMPWALDEADRLADDWQVFELPEDFAHLEHDSPFC